MISVIDWQLAHHIVSELPQESLDRAMSVLLAATEIVRQRQCEERNYKAPRKRDPDNVTQLKHGAS
jgi:hypothetical protein